MKKLFILMILCLFMTGCVSWLAPLCNIAGDDSAHCVQWMAVQTGDANTCDKVPLKVQFKDTGSNPPKDKCYLMVAEKEADTGACDRIKGGYMSYTIEECYSNAAAVNKDADLCKGSPDEIECRTNTATSYDNYGNCGQGFELVENRCRKAEKKDDDDDEDKTACPKDEIYQKCVSSNSLEICEKGKLSYETCEFGCFEAACRNEKGETDIEPEETDTEDGEDEADSDDEEDEEEDEEKEEKPECKSNADCSPDEECASGKCVEKGCTKNSDCAEDEECFAGECIEKECTKNSDCAEDEECFAGECIEKECTKDSDCGEDEECDSGMCFPKTECNPGTVYCLGSEKVVKCENYKFVNYACKYGCNEGKCMTAEEKDKEDGKKEEQESCKESYSSCISESRLEFCVDGKKSDTFCEFGCKGGECLPMEEAEPEDDGCPWWNPFCEDQNKADVKDIADYTSGKYMEALDAEIDKEKDPAKLMGLKKYKEFLESAGNKIEGAQATLETLGEMKKIFLDSYDPSMDIENMKVDKILQKSFSERVSDSLEPLKFWKGDKTPEMIEQDMALEQFKVYKAMLERQEEIDFLKQSKKDRLVGTLVSKAKEKAVGELTDKATEIAEDVAGSAFITVSIAGKAIDGVKDTANEMMYTGLIKAYNRRRNALEKDNPDMSDEELHKLTVQQVEKHPYDDVKSFTRIAQFGNLLENKDCKDSSNPLCIDRNVFWTSMQKSYDHLNQQKLFQRNMDQLDRRIERSKSS